MPTIQAYINDRNKYNVDPTYQRPNNAWSHEDNQCFIDTLLREEPIPIFFLNYVTSEGLYFVVDGQQRLNCISMFYDNKLRLNKKFSGATNHGRTFNGDNALDDDQKRRFLDYDLKFHIMEDYDDERVRLIFSRLQRGKPLQIGERLNAKPGAIVQSIRAIANHPFLAKSIAIAQNRYGSYPDAARMLFYERHKAKQCGIAELDEFFDENRALDQSSQEFRAATRVLNYLEKCFPSDQGPHRCFEKHAWVLAAYTMVRDLQVSHAIPGCEDKIRAFIADFHGKVYKEDFRRSKADYQRFYENVRGGWSEKIITLRRDILIREFLSRHRIPELDDKRQISDEDKIAVFANRPSCEKCGRGLRDFREAEYHHKEPYARGGKTRTDNIMVLCGVP